ncbi:MAG: DUF1045 domain-containing protein [Rhodobacterales bacterium]|nr:DUF1045 domain-containing protein [Rhodobacterales bacterium]
MTEIVRYAIYLVPTGDFAAFGAAWLGWDITLGHAVTHPAVEGLPRPLTELTAAARTYGFHATIKPPFRLAAETSPDDLTAAAATLAACEAPFDCAGLELTEMDGFLALTPTGDTTRLAALAARVVADLDRFRAPAPPEETARRRAVGLTSKQEEYLTRWGYPYVMDQFHAHFTLTGRLAPTEAPVLRDLLTPLTAPFTTGPFRVDSICLVGQQASGGFRLFNRLTLTGRP